MPLRPAATFVCGSCGKTHAWKAELAGKKGKCGCGNIMTIPAQPTRADDHDDGLYGLADSSAVPAKAVAVAASGVPLGYRPSRTARQSERSSAGVYLDLKRDLLVPVALMAVGSLLYIGYFALRYQLGSAGITGVGIGLTLLTILETTVLIGFALVVANPLGVSFGGVGTAILKFAAIAAFSDGMITCVVGVIAKLAGMGGGVGSYMVYGLIGFPIALGIYWILLTYLFSMDPSDSWYVIAVLSVFYQILHTLLLLLLLKLVLSMGGASAAAVALGAGGAPAAPSAVADEVDEARQEGLLIEARKYIHDRGRKLALDYVNDWYAAGCPNVWYIVNRNVIGAENGYLIVVEMPVDQAARAKCYDIVKAYYNFYKIPYDPALMPDNGDPYLLVPLPAK